MQNDTYGTNKINRTNIFVKNLAHNWKLQNEVDLLKKLFISVFQSYF